MSWMRRAGLVGCALALTAGCTRQPEFGSSHVGGNAQRTGVYDSRAVDRLTEAVWKTQVDLSSSSVVVSNGRVYFGGKDGAVHAVNASTGQEEWKHKLQMKGILSAPAVSNGVVFAVGAKALYALDEASGQERWRFASLGDAIGSPVVVGDVVYAAGEAVYAINASTGKEKWRYRLRKEDALVGAELAVADSIVYAGTMAGTLLALNAATGQEIWTFRVPRPESEQGKEVTLVELPFGILGGPAVADGVVYFRCLNGAVYAIDAKTGGLKWHVTSVKSHLDPIVANGVVYVAGPNEGRLLALNARTGQEMWNVTLAGGISSELILAAGVLYVGGQQLYALDAATGSQKWKFTVDGEATSPAIAGGVLYFGSSEGYLYAVR